MCAHSMTNSHVLGMLLCLVSVVNIEYCGHFNTIYWWVFYEVNNYDLCYIWLLYLSRQTIIGNGKVSTFTGVVSRREFIAWVRVNC